MRACRCVCGRAGVHACVCADRDRLVCGFGIRPHPSKRICQLIQHSRSRARERRTHNTPRPIHSTQHTAGDTRPQHKTHNAHNTPTHTHDTHTPVSPEGRRRNFPRLVFYLAGSVKSIRKSRVCLQRIVGGIRRRKGSARSVCLRVEYVSDARVQVVWPSAVSVTCAFRMFRTVCSKHSECL